MIMIDFFEMHLVGVDAEIKQIRLVNWALYTMLTGMVLDVVYCQ